jgi:hypothetical protein
LLFDFFSFLFSVARIDPYDHALGVMRDVPRGELSTDAALLSTAALRKRKWPG